MVAPVLRRGGALVVLLLGMAGCGDSGSARADFLQEANATCGQHREKIEAAASKVLAGGSLPSPEQFGRLAQETIIPELTAQFRELGELDPPEDLSDDIDAYVAQGEEVLQRMQQDPSFLADAANFTAVNDSATSIGLSDSCHVGPG